MNVIGAPIFGIVSGVRDLLSRAWKLLKANHGGLDASDGLRNRYDVMSSFKESAEVFFFVSLFYTFLSSKCCKS